MLSAVAGIEKLEDVEEGTKLSILMVLLVKGAAAGRKITALQERVRKRFED